MRVSRLILVIMITYPSLMCAIPVTTSSNPPVIVFDYSHGQRNSFVDHLDQLLTQNLTDMGYEVVWATGGLNTSILSDASGLVLGSIYGVQNGFIPDEVVAISNWFEAGERFLWVSYDSDYDGSTYINDNMTLILEFVGSHVYGEPTSIADAISNAGASYRVIATGTTTDSRVSHTVAGVDAVLMHNPTLLYGSDSSTPRPELNPVALETHSIEDVYPLLFYNDSSEIYDFDEVPPIAHDDADVGAFVTATIELGVGTYGTGVIVTSGGSPYGDYMPMYSYEYYDHPLNGWKFVQQTIDFGMKLMDENTSPVIEDFTLVSMILFIGAGFSIIAVIGVIYLMMKFRVKSSWYS